jgi:hypothetical protein
MDDREHPLIWLIIGCGLLAETLKQGLRLYGALVISVAYRYPAVTWDRRQVGEHEGSTGPPMIAKATRKSAIQNPRWLSRYGETDRRDPRYLLVSPAFLPCGMTLYVYGDFNARRLLSLLSASTRRWRERREITSRRLVASP